MTDVVFEMPTKEQEQKLMKFIFANADAVKFFGESVLASGHRKKLDATLKLMENDFIIKETNSIGFLPFSKNDYYVFMLSGGLKDSLRKESLFVFNMVGGPLYSLIEPAFYKNGKMMAEVECSGCHSVVLHVDDKQLKSLKTLGLMPKKQDKKK